MSASNSELQELEAYLERCGPQDEALPIMAKLVTLYFKEGNYISAEPLAASCLENAKATYGDNHSNTIFAMIALANVYVCNNKLELSESLYLECLRKCKVDDYRNRINANDGIANVYRKKKEFDQAEDYFKERYDLCVLVYGHDNHQSFSAMNDLASNLFNQGFFNL